MGKSQVPRGTTRKVPCEDCGVLYYPQVYGSAAKLTKKCPVCDPKAYKHEKK